MAEKAPKNTTATTNAAATATLVPPPRTLMGATKGPASDFPLPPQLHGLTSPSCSGTHHTKSMMTPPLLEFGTGCDLQWLSDVYLASKEDTNEEESQRLKIIMTETEVMMVVRHLSLAIDKRYAGCTEPVLMVGILNGVAFFFSHLMKLLHIPYEICFAKVETYGDSQKQRDVQKGGAGKEVIVLDAHRVKRGRSVLLLDELEDNGITMNLVRERLLSMGVEEGDLTTCVLFSKVKDAPSHARRSDIHGVLVPNVWLVGWGLDYKRQKRGWKHLYGITKDAGIPPSRDDAIFASVQTSPLEPPSSEGFSGGEGGGGGGSVQKKQHYRFCVPQAYVEVRFKLIDQLSRIMQRLIAHNYTEKKELLTRASSDYLMGSGTISADFEEESPMVPSPIAKRQKLNSFMSS